MDLWELQKQYVKNREKDQRKEDELRKSLTKKYTLHKENPEIEKRIGYAFYKLAKENALVQLGDYLSTYKLTPRELAMKIILDVIENTGITATAGIGTNLYLCKVAMDILAKHIPADENGVRIAELDEMTYRHVYHGRCCANVGMQ